MKLRTILLAIVIAGLFLPGCKKQKESKSGYYIRYKANGEWITWIDVFGDLGPHLTENGRTVFGLESFGEAEQDAFDIFMVKDGNIGTGSYNFPANAITIDYRLNAYTPSETIYNLYQVSGRPAPQFTLTLTSITAEEIRGTFTGNYLALNGTSEVIEITEGDFVIPRIR